MSGIASAVERERRYVRAPVHDVYVDGQQCAVYAEDNVLVLSPIATTLLLALADRPHTLASLVDAVVGQFGQPPESSPEQAVRDQLDDLLAAGLVLPESG